jgi:hypothetical protein
VTMPAFRQSLQLGMHTTRLLITDHGEVFDCDQQQLLAVGCCPGKQCHSYSERICPCVTTAPFPRHKTNQTKNAPVSRPPDVSKPMPAFRQASQLSAHTDALKPLVACCWRRLSSAQLVQTDEFLTTSGEPTCHASTQQSLSHRFSSSSAPKIPDLHPTYAHSSSCGLPGLSMQPVPQHRMLRIIQMIQTGHPLH